MRALLLVATLLAVLVAGQWQNGCNYNTDNAHCTSTYTCREGTNFWSYPTNQCVMTLLPNTTGLPQATGEWLVEISLPNVYAGSTFTIMDMAGTVLSMASGK